MAADVERHVGTALPTIEVVVERGPVMNFATAVTDRNPVFHDADAARRAGHEGLPTPPTYPFVMHTFGAFPELQPPPASAGGGADNPVTAIIAELMADGGMLLHGEQGFHWERPVVVGDRLTGTGSIKDVAVKQSPDRTMTFVVVETQWRDPQGALVCTSTMTLVHRR